MASAVGTGGGAWVPLPVGCWLKGQFCSLVRARGLEHPHSVTGRRGLGWRGVRPSQSEGGDGGQLAFGAGVLGEEMQLLMLLRVISFPCISRKASFLSSCVLILIHVTSFSETELKCSFCLRLFLKSRATQRMVAGVEPVPIRPFSRGGQWTLHLGKCSGTQTQVAEV